MTYPFNNQWWYIIHSKGAFYNKVHISDPNTLFSELDSIALRIFVSFKEKEKWPAGLVNHRLVARNLKIKLLWLRWYHLPQDTNTESKIYKKWIMNPVYLYFPAVSVQMCTTQLLLHLWTFFFLIFLPNIKWISYLKNKP